MAALALAGLALVNVGILAGVVVRQPFETTGSDEAPTSAVTTPALPAAGQALRVLIQVPVP
jgi:hypothetical protein